MSKFTIQDIQNSPAGRLNPQLKMPENGTTKEKKNKYHALKTTVDDVTFDSKKEAKRYRELRLLLKEGKIAFLARQVYFAFHIQGETVGGYVADFVYSESVSGKMMVEDVKSEVTRKLPVYRLKRRLMLAIHGIKIKEV